MADDPIVPNPTPEDGAIAPGSGMTWAGWCGGLLFISLVLVLALKVPEPTGFQEWAFRVPMAIGAAAFCAFVPGFLLVRAITSKPTHQAGICGGGAIVVFVLLMFVNPTRLGTPVAKLVGSSAADKDGTKQSQPTDVRIAGRVYEPSGNGVAGATVNVVGVKTATSVDHGNFELYVPAALRSPKYRVAVTHPKYVA